jgi:diguanylate cyclase (GGDEF)-like protein/PAS domain S-box-containing protein
MTTPDAALAQALLEAMTEALYVVDNDRTITYWNPAAEQLTGFRAQEVIGRHCRDGILNHVDEAGRLMCQTSCPLLGTISDGRPRTVSMFLHHHDGHRIPVAVSAAALRDSDGQVHGAVEVFHDESRVREIADQLDAARAAALSDPLTGIGNRTMLYQALERHVSEFGRHGRTFAVLFADIDRFKTINDHYGHDVGDKILQLVAATMRDCIRPSDTAGRWGGEEFLILAPVTDEDQALALAERLRTMVASGWLDTDGRTITVTVSIGIALIRQAEPATTLIERADAAMYTAKADGRNRTALA